VGQTDRQRLAALGRRSDGERAALDNGGRFERDGTLVDGGHDGRPQDEREPGGERGETTMTH
jgi:hypothetical protein